MRILVVNPGGNASGGAERSIALLIGSLTKRGHQVGVATLLPGDAAEAFSAHGGQVLANGLRNGIGRSQRHESSSAFLTGAIRMLPEAVAVAREIRAIGSAFRADVIHTNGLRAHALTPFLGRLPVVWSLRERPPGWPAQQLTRRAAKWAAAVVAPSQFASQLAVGCRCPIYVIPNPIESSMVGDTDAARTALGLPTGRQMVGLVAHHHPTKGHHVAIDAWRHLPPPRPLLVLAGGDLYGPASVRYRDVLSSAIANGALQADVTLAGLVGDMASFYSACDLVVHPALYPEGFGRSVAEAQLSGVPVIASDIGAAPELIQHGKTGMLVPPGDSHALAETVLQLLGDATLRRQLRRGGLAAHARYDPAAHGAAVESVYLAVTR